MDDPTTGDQVFETVAELFAWETMVAKETMAPWLAAAKGVPLPAMEGRLLWLREK